MNGDLDALSDEALIDKARNSDQRAFELLCDRALPAVYNHLRARLPPGAVEDVTQEVFVAAARGFARFRGNASFRTWVRGIARHKVADYYRRQNRRPETVPLDAATYVTGEDGATEGETSRDRWEERLLVRVVLRRMPDHYQEIILLRFAEGLKFKTMARELGISLDAAKSRYRRAVKALAEEMGRET